MSAQPRRAMTRRQAGSLAFLLSAALHLMVLGWFGLKRAVAEWRAEPSAVNVQLVRLPASAPLKAEAPASRATGRPSRATADGAAAVPLPASDNDAGTPGVAVDPRWRVDRKGPIPQPRREPDPGAFQPCDPLKDPRREGKACRKVDEIAEAVTRFYDPQRSKSADAREARRNEALRRYRDAPGGAGYPGIGCALLHRC